MKWFKSVGARCGNRSVRLGEASSPGPPKRLLRNFASASHSTNRFEISSGQGQIICASRSSPS